jgi:EAL domain-containing protein (putative c-di-GMP-specific phosphodiesterase class I)
VYSALGETGLNPQQMHLEVTETAILSNEQAAAQTLSALRQEGVRLDLDDFGRGNSSLVRLHELPVDRLKLDGAFVRDMSGRRDLAAVVYAISTLADNLGLDVIAEQIETPEQLAAMQSLNCDFGQGFYFGHPQPIAELLTRCRSFEQLPGALQKRLGQCRAYCVQRNDT